MQEYLVEGSKNPKKSRLIFKARGRNLEIKTHKKWRYEDEICVGQMMSSYCVQGLVRKNETLSEKYAYSWFFGDSDEKMIHVAKEIESRLKIRKKILDDPV